MQCITNEKLSHYIQFTWINVIAYVDHTVFIEFFFWCAINVSCDTFYAAKFVRSRDYEDKNAERVLV